MFDPSAPTPEMKISVSLGDFHSTHDRAFAAQQKVVKGLKDIPKPELLQMLGALRAGQKLTDAEDGSDFMYASQYIDEIRLVEAELRQRESKDSNEKA